MQSVRLLIVATKFDVEDHGRDILAIGRAIKRNFKPAMHSKRAVAFVIETDETAKGLVNRLRGVLNNDRIHNFWCLSPDDEIVGMDGALDPLAVRVREAWDRVRKRNKAEQMKESKRPENFFKWTVDDLVGRAPVKVNHRPRRKRKPSRKPNRPEYF